MNFLITNEAAAQGVLGLVRTIFEYAWDIPFKIPFFMFPFSFGHVFYGLVFMDIGILICKKFLDTSHDDDNFRRV